VSIGAALRYAERTYRTSPPLGARWVSFGIVVETTDLYVLAERDLSAQARRLAAQARGEVIRHIRQVPLFATSLSPLEPPEGELPPVLAELYEAGRLAGVGPMAAVAGAIAECVGRGLRTCSPEVVVENGGDVYLDVEDEVVVSVFAGTSPFSGRIGLRIPPSDKPLSVCTSSATVGPSLSFGEADAATVLARSAALADAVATGLGNRIRRSEDLEPALEWALAVPGVHGALAVFRDRLAVRGQVELTRV
jgi:uncharacterized protein